MKYKGYIGVVDFDEDAGIFHGEVINTRDVITFQGTCVEELRQAFIDSVEDYLDFCKQRGEDPEKPFKGNLGLRMPPDVHREAFIRAKQMGISLNEWINRAIEKQLSI
jgi:predicted HicB family RNase H-like nuclease